MYNPMSLHGKRIMVTGASSGIGRSCAQVMSRLGARLLLVGRDPVRLQQTLESLEGDGHCAIPFDFTDVDTIPGWMKRLTEEGSVLDGLVHSAGIQFTRPLQVMKISDYRELMCVNLDAAIALAKGFRQRGVSNRPGTLVFISSVSGMVGQAGNAAYSASKGALISLSRSLSLEFIRDGIRVNCISPGLVETEIAEKMRCELPAAQLNAILAMHPLGIGRPEDVAFAAAYLMAETGRWITGSNLVVDGGYTAH